MIIFANKVNLKTIKMKIKYIDADKETYTDFDWKKDDVSDYLKLKEIINIETLKTTIRFWYKEY